MGTPGVKWVSLFLKYLHPLIPVFIARSIVRMALTRLTKKAFL